MIRNWAQLVLLKEAVQSLLQLKLTPGGLRLLAASFESSHHNNLSDPTDVHLSQAEDPKYDPQLYTDSSTLESSDYNNRLGNDRRVSC